MVVAPLGGASARRSGDANDGLGFEELGKHAQSLEPPPLVLMRDHFAACLCISLLLSSCLFGTLMLAVRGAVRPMRLPEEEDADGESQETDSP